MYLLTFTFLLIFSLVVIILATTSEHTTNVLRSLQEISMELPARRNWYNYL